MKAVIFFQVLLFSILSTYVEAVLPPLYHTASQIQAILNDPELSRYFDSGESIESIQKSAEGWIVKGTKHTVFVSIMAVPARQPGPSEFKLIWNP